MIWIYYYILKGIRLDLELHNSYDKYLANCATNNINIWFYTNQTLYNPGKLDLTVLQIVLKII